MLRHTSAIRRGSSVALLAVAASAVAIPVALAATWNASCNDQEACVWKHGNFGIPKAAKDGDDGQYNNDNWPNTTDNMNDETSSIKNKYNVKRVFWFFNSGYEGTSFCLQAGWESGDLNSHNDEYSSHLIATSGSC